jgi:hypothetical protein
LSLIQIRMQHQENHGYDSAAVAGDEEENEFENDDVLEQLPMQVLMQDHIPLFDPNTNRVHVCARSVHVCDDYQMSVDVGAVSLQLPSG